MEGQTYAGTYTRRDVHILGAWRADTHNGDMQTVGGPIQDIHTVGTYTWKDGHARGGDIHTLVTCKRWTDIHTPGCTHDEDIHMEGHIHAEAYTRWGQTHGGTYIQCDSHKE